MSEKITYTREQMVDIVGAITFYVCATATTAEDLADNKSFDIINVICAECFGMTEKDETDALCTEAAIKACVKHIERVGGGIVPEVVVNEISRDLWSTYDKVHGSGKAAFDA